MNVPWMVPVYWTYTDVGAALIAWWRSQGILTNARGEEDWEETPFIRDLAEAAVQLMALQPPPMIVVPAPKYGPGGFVRDC
jgi:hypothetical protein